MSYKASISSKAAGAQNDISFVCCDGKSGIMNESPGRVADLY